MLRLEEEKFHDDIKPDDDVREEGFEFSTFLTDLWSGVDDPRDAEALAEDDRGTSERTTAGYMACIVLHKSKT